MEPRNIGQFVKLIRGIPPQDSAAATINGSAIDRAVSGGTLYLSCVLHHTVGAASGTPDSFTAASKLQDSADGSTDWTDLAGAAAATLTADNAEAEVNVDLSVARRYIRVVEVLAFVAGTTPKIEVAATVALGGADTLPV